MPNTGDQISDKQELLASEALAAAVVAIASRNGTDGIEKEATKVAKALVAGMKVISATDSAD